MSKKYLSYSTLNNFDRCSYIFYLDKIKHLRLKQEHQSIALRKGAYLGQLLSNQSIKINQATYFHDYEEKDKKLVEAMVDIIEELELIPENCKYEVTFTKSFEHEFFREEINVKGIVDLIKLGWFGETKYTAKVDWYLNTWFAYNQLLMYFYLTPPEIVRGYMLPIQVPQTKLGKTEDVDDYIARTVKDVKKRPSHYFPGYKVDGGNDVGPKWGRCFYRTEFGDKFKWLEKKMAWIREEISRCVKAGYFVQRSNNCLFPGECSYISICETGFVNEELYESI